jgi:hypothetical protein
MALSISTANSTPDTDSPISLVLARSATLDQLRSLDKRSTNWKRGLKGISPHRNNPKDFVMDIQSERDFRSVPLGWWVLAPFDPPCPPVVPLKFSGCGCF